MGSSYGEAVFDFDLNFLHPTSNNAVTQSKLDKQRRAIVIVKKKVIATDSLIKKYFTKKDELDLTEKNLLASKDECKQICLDYRKSLDSCSVLENDMLILQNTNKELAEKCFQVENQLGASKSHTHQLQILVKEYETLIKSLKIENKLAKSNAKDSEKKLLSIQKEHQTIIKHITLARDVIFKRKKLTSSHKIILQKYDKYKAENSDDSIIGTVSSEEDDFEDASLSPFYEDENTIEPINCDQVLISPDTTTGMKPLNITHGSTIKNNLNQDIEYSNDLGSVDTGRGSSLALSDSDKFSHSTDYFINNSPLSDVSIANTHKPKLVDTGTSPVPTYSSVHTATSPVPTYSSIHTATSPVPTYSSIHTATSPVPTYSSVHTATSPIQFDKSRLGFVDIGVNTDNCGLDLPDVFNSMESAGVVMVEHAVSPIALCKTIERAVSPISNLHADMATSPIQFNKNDQNNVHQYKKTQQLRECLELNSSNNLCDERDGEIELILSRMRMEHELVTPIPLTPVKSRCANKMEVSLTTKHIEHLSNFDCPDAALVREENKKLQASISELVKEINGIKSILKIHFSPVNQSEDNGIVHPNKCNVLLSIDNLNEDNGFVYENEDNHLLINDHLSEDNVLDISNSNVIKTPILEPSNDYESYTIINQEIPNNEDVNELEDIESNLPLQNSTNYLHSITSPYTEIENEENDLIGFDSIVESTDYKEKITAPNDFKLRSPIVRCEKLDMSKVCNIVNNTQKEKEPQNASRKIAKVKKLTRLSKFKRRILPKYKIKVDYTQSLKRSRVKPRKVVMPKKKKIITDQDSSATLNDKCIYQKAIKVMAALKLKQKSEISQSIHAVSGNKRKEHIDANNKENTVAKIGKRKSLDQRDDQCNDKEEFVNESSLLLNNSIATRSRRKYSRSNTESNNNSVTVKDLDQDNIPLSDLRKREMSINASKLPETRKRLRSSEDILEFPNKRLLRSSINHSQANVPEKMITKNDTHLNVGINSTESSSLNDKNTFISAEVNKDMLNRCKKTRKSSTTQENDSIHNTIMSHDTENHTSSNIQDTNPKQSILCVMIQKYGVQSVKYCVNKLSESIIDSIAKRIEDEIKNIIELPYNETKDAMNKLVTVIGKWNIKHFVSGLMKYLQDPSRKLELYKTLELPPAPPMTKPEQVLLYIVAQLNNCWPTTNIVDKILSSIEYILFALNRTPHFEIIESMSHFYAVVCRYFKLKSRLRLFMLDAMYCIQYKSITLIKQCLDVWTHILPLAHMGIAKNPLVTCLVYLLHFYKCEDKYNKVRDMRFMLSRNYFYKFTDWNETHILEMFRSSIKEIKSTNQGSLVEKKMLRIALIILAKRQGPKWCHNNIIKKLLQPIIENDKTEESVKEFCISLLGPLMKPYPIDMKVHCEVVMNRLFNMLQNNPSSNMTEAIMTSLIYMNRHNQHRVIEAMISWNPHEVSYEFEEIVRGFVRSKPIKAWKTTLARIPL